MRARVLIISVLALVLAACGAQTAQNEGAPTPTMTPRPTFTATAVPTATPMPTNTPLPTPTPAVTDTPIPEPTPTPRIHVVQSGETLSGIAAAYGVTTQDLIDANDISNPSLVVVGQELKIP